VTTERELAGALADALGRTGPTVIDASIDPAWPRLRSMTAG
jgi:hypothetical protein